MRFPLRATAMVSGLLLWLTSPEHAAAQWTAADSARLTPEHYIAPDAALASLVTAPWHLNVALSELSPDGRAFLRLVSDGLPTAAAFARPHLKLAGLQVDPGAHRARTLTTRAGAGLALIDTRTGASRTVSVPSGATVSNPAWSPDGSQVAFIANTPTASHAWVADAATGRSRQVTRAPLLATLVSSITWTADGRQLVVVLVPSARGAAPVAPEVAVGPRVQLWTSGAESPQRMHASLLEWPHEFAQFAWHATGQLAMVDVRTRAVRTVGAPAMIRSVSVSPDAQVLRVVTIQRPFSSVVPWQQFGTREELWDLNGAMLAELAVRPLREVPDTSTWGGPGGQGVTTGNKRGLAWMPRGPGLYYLEAPPVRADSGTAGSGPAPTEGNASRPGRVVQWLPPFGAGDTVTLHRGDGPIASVAMSEDAATLFVATNRQGTGEVYAVRLASPETRHSILRQRAWSPGFAALGASAGGMSGGGRGGIPANDSLAFYGNPGAIVTRPSASGTPVVVVSRDGAVFLGGTKYHPDWMREAPRAFLDKVVIASAERTRVFDGAAGMAETVVGALDDDMHALLLSRESPTQVPDLWRRAGDGALTRLTQNEDRAPAFTALRRERIWVTRPDGMRFMVRVTLPATYREGTRLPGMFWLYPYEFTSQAEYDRRVRTEHIHRFVQPGPRSIEHLATQGYAVANFDPPIMGDRGRMNDNYIPDLRMNLLAVIDELDRRGWIDRQRLGIGGHSYGGFATANAMVSTPFFRAGIAGAGMYNRTLTPTGFQSEERDIWTAQRTYLEMSPMLVAERLQGALLLYHSLDDQNVGTNPISSIRMMQALRAHGKTASLYLYPYEDHGPVIRESLLDLWARWTGWLEVYVRRAGGPTAR